MSGKYPVLDTFTVTTPSLSVVIRADDTPLPSDLRAQQAQQANLVTVHAVEVKESVAPRTEATSGSFEVSEGIEEDPAWQSVLQRRSILAHRFAELHSLRQQQPLDQNMLRELNGLNQEIRREAALEQQELQAQAEFEDVLRRSESKYANELYGQFGSAPPIQPLDAVVSEVDPEGFIKRVSTYETKDFTYWDKLRRRNTQTVIRRWKTFMPEDEEDTAFFARNLQADVPGEAYAQGLFYKALDIAIGAKEYKLPTRGYVAPPLYIRRTGNVERRMHDPMRQMARSLNSCCCASTC